MKEGYRMDFLFYFWFKKETKICTLSSTLSVFKSSLNWYPFLISIIIYLYWFAGLSKSISIYNKYINIKKGY